MRTEIALTLTVQELDYVMNTLAQRPFVEVNGLISKMVNQANSQPAEIPAQRPEPVPEVLPGETHG